MLKLNGQQHGIIKKTNGDFMQGLQRFYSDNGGLAYAKGNLKILFYAAFSKEIVLKKAEIVPVRNLQSGFCRLLDMTSDIVEAAVAANLPRLEEGMDQDRLFMQEFFKYRSLLDWKTFFAEMFSCSLLHQSMVDFSDLADNPILLHDYSFKLLDATHLLLVRDAAGYCRECRPCLRHKIEIELEK